MHAEYTSPNPTPYLVPNLDRALSIIELMAQHSEGLTIQEIVQRLKVPKSSVFRIVLTLVDRQYAVRDEKTNRYALSARLLWLAHMAVAEHSIVEKALDLMRDLRDQYKETVCIGSIIGRQFVVLDQVLGLHPFKFMLDVGMHVPLHSNAPGKCVLAFLPDDKRNELIEGMRLERYTANTLTTREELQKELDEIRESGYSVDRGEMIEGAHCVSAPVFDRQRFPVAAIWTTGPSDRMPMAQFPEIAPSVIACAHQISRRLGGAWS